MEKRQLNWWQKSLLYSAIALLAMAYVIVMFIVADSYPTMLTTLAVLFIVHWFCRSIQKYCWYKRAKKSVITITIVCFLVLQTFNIYGTHCLRKAFEEAGKRNCPLTVADLWKNFAHGDDLKFTVNGLPLAQGVSQIIQKQYEYFCETLQDQDLKYMLTWFPLDRDLAKFQSPSKKHLEHISQLMSLTEDHVAILEKALDSPKFEPYYSLYSKSSHFETLLFSSLPSMIKFYQLRCYYFLHTKQFDSLENCISKMFRLVSALEGECLMSSQSYRIRTQISVLEECYRYYLVCDDKERLQRLQNMVQDYCEYNSINVSWELLYLHSWAEQDMWKYPEELEIDKFMGIKAPIIPRGFGKWFLANIVSYYTLHFQKINKTEDEAYKLILPAIKDEKISPYYNHLVNMAMKEFNKLAQARSLVAAIDITLNNSEKLDFELLQKNSLFKDPFTQKSLICKNIAGKYYIYSVGKDLKDDNARFARQGKNFDIGVRVK
ncbi:hypothetical protein [Candidatus Uabimicrobium sp. HlEnr_7]|uniref:hypothetical protein n=1 Tax=Candidatus Uabimicrobium helgolandensis TaxID=3095367 RepID=UPI003556194A